MDSIKIIIADDEPLIRMDLRIVLESIGHTVIAEAEDGKQAIDLTRSLKPDLVMLDIMMPNLDGLEAAKMIRVEDIAPVMLISGFAEEDMLKKADEAGVLSYIRKPFSQNDLIPAISIALGRYRERKTLELEIETLKEKIEVRKIIGRAKALLMERYHLTEREAFYRIQNRSQIMQKPAHEIAKAIIMANELGI